MARRIARAGAAEKGEHSAARARFVLRRFLDGRLFSVEPYLPPAPRAPPPPPLPPPPAAPPPDVEESVPLRLVDPLALPFDCPRMEFIEFIDLEL
jgi:hypothetical protein